MGMFDSVFVRCPKCNADVEIQTKAGDCVLRKYMASGVPMAIAQSLNCLRQRCDACGQGFRLVVPGTIPDLISMQVVLDKDPEAHEFLPEIGDEK